MFIAQPERISGSKAYTLAELASRAVASEDPEDTIAFMEAIEAAGAEFAEYCEDMLRLRDDLHMTIAGIDSEIKRLTNLKAEREAKAERISNALMAWLEMTGNTEVVTDLHTIRMRRNPPKVDIYDEAVVPSMFHVEQVTTRIDKKAISEALKSGVPVDGCKLTQSYRLEVK